VDTDHVIAAELRTLRDVPDVLGSVLAGPDGLLIASDVHQVEPDTIAAMAAATVGLGRRFCETVGLGAHRETVIQAEGGSLVSYAAGPGALLTVVVRPGGNLARIHLTARTVAQRVGALAEAAVAPRQPATAPPPPPPRPIVPAAREPLPRRTTRTTGPARHGAARP